MLRSAIVSGVLGALVAATNCEALSLRAGGKPQTTTPGSPLNVNVVEDERRAAAASLLDLGKSMSPCLKAFDARRLEFLLGSGES